MVLSKHQHAFFTRQASEAALVPLTQAGTAEYYILTG